MTDLVRMEEARAAARRHEEENLRSWEVIEGYKITNAAEQEQARELLLAVKEELDRQEEVRTSFVKPLNDVVRTINAYFKPALDHLKKSEVVLKEMIGRFVLQQREEQRKLLQAAAAAMETTTAVQVAAGRDPAKTLMQAAQDAAAPKLAGVTVREVYDWEVVDEALVPREYLTVDASAVGKAVRAGTREIPGLRIFKTTSVIARTAR